MKRVYFEWKGRFYPIEEVGQKIIKHMNKESNYSATLTLKVVGIDEPVDNRLPREVRDATIDMESYGEGYDLTDEK